MAATSRPSGARPGRIEAGRPGRAGVTGEDETVPPDRRPEGRGDPFRRIADRLMEDSGVAASPPQRGAAAASSDAPATNAPPTRPTSPAAPAGTSVPPGAAGGGHGEPQAGFPRRRAETPALQRDGAPHRRGRGGARRLVAAVSAVAAIGALVLFFLASTPSPIVGPPPAPLLTVGRLAAPFAPISPPVPAVAPPPPTAAAGAPQVPAVVSEPTPPFAGPADVQGAPLLAPPPPPRNAP